MNCLRHTRHCWKISRARVLKFYPSLTFLTSKTSSAFHWGPKYMAVDKLDKMSNPMQTDFPCTHMIYKASEYFPRTALVDSSDSYSYVFIYTKSVSLARRLHKAYPLNMEQTNVIAFFYDNNVNYVVMLWAIWMLGAVALPLNHAYPQEDLEYFLSDSKATILLTTQNHREKAVSFSQQGTIPVVYQSITSNQNLVFESYDDLEFANGEQWLLQKPALMIYTSGTTGKPKGVLLSHTNLHIYILGMIDAWRWVGNDRILHTLPLNHVHGVVNALLTPLYCGATVYMLPKFDAKLVLERLLESSKNSITLFMGVPTMYALMIRYYDEEYGNASEEIRNVIKEQLQKLRLFVSGSAPLPIPVLDKWREISGHTILERYGMTEIGMALTNPYKGERVPGAVGLPFKYVSFIIGNYNAYVDGEYEVIAEGNDEEVKVTEGKEGHEGELLIKGPGVFSAYWNAPLKTSESFTSKGWFKTGDMAVYEDGVVKIKGRISVDIIKYGGFKISALEIENILLQHPDVQECSVVGVSDITWGQKVAAIVALKPGASDMTQESLQTWAKDRLPKHKMPSIVKFVDQIPRNSMGKINKKGLIKEYFRQTRSV
ncbi:malonate--CoA ligase ACSF3, mitochondrial-like [Saccostrea echinata]|uniref:malonate--CoA ligase ACSF3, mitochondrial-like n=1 Tax=Saccostrea echinata TaxID=191078 RepID=UPI002A82BE0D|nr:malonate--CoA ligase ACSF3, mitochondrial-like [Saccostrea echinata]